MIADGNRREDVADLFKMGRVILNGRCSECLVRVIMSFIIRIRRTPGEGFCVAQRVLYATHS